MKGFTVSLTSALIILAALIGAKAQPQQLTNKQISQSQVKQQQQQEEPRPEPYSFAYSAESVGGFSSHSESGDGTGRVTGFYTIQGEDGRERRVDYVADENGYRAQVSSNEIGLRNQNSADVQMKVQLPSPKQLEAAKVSAEQYQYLENRHLAERQRAASAHRGQRLSGQQSTQVSSESSGSLRSVLLQAGSGQQINNVAGSVEPISQNQQQQQPAQVASSSANPVTSAPASSDADLGWRQGQRQGRQAQTTLGSEVNNLDVVTQTTGGRWQPPRSNGKKPVTVLQRQLEAQFMQQATQLTDQDYPRQSNDVQETPLWTIGSSSNSRQTLSNKNSLPSQESVAEFAQQQQSNILNDLSGQLDTDEESLQNGIQQQQQSGIVLQDNQQQFIGSQAANNILQPKLTQTVNLEQTNGVKEQQQSLTQQNSLPPPPPPPRPVVLQEADQPAIITDRPSFVEGQIVNLATGNVVQQQNQNLIPVDQPNQSVQVNEEPVSLVGGTIDTIPQQPQFMQQQQQFQESTGKVNIQQQVQPEQQFNQQFTATSGQQTGIIMRQTAVKLPQAVNEVPVEIPSTTRATPSSSTTTAAAVTTTTEISTPEEPSTTTTTTTSTTNGPTSSVQFGEEPIAVKQQELIQIVRQPQQLPVKSVQGVKGRSKNVAVTSFQSRPIQQNIVQQPSTVAYERPTSSVEPSLVPVITSTQPEVTQTITTQQAPIFQPQRNRVTSQQPIVTTRLPFLGVQSTTTTIPLITNQPEIPRTEYSIPKQEGQQRLVQQSGGVKQLTIGGTKGGGRKSGGNQTQFWQRPQQQQQSTKTNNNSLVGQQAATTTTIAANNNNNYYSSGFSFGSRLAASSASN